MISIFVHLLNLSTSLVFGDHSFGKSEFKTGDGLCLVTHQCSQLLGFATEELSLRVGQTIGGLLNATLVGSVAFVSKHSLMFLTF